MNPERHDQLMIVSVDDGGSVASHDMCLMSASWGGRRLCNGSSSLDGFLDTRIFGDDLELAAISSLVCVGFCCLQLASIHCQGQE